MITTVCLNPAIDKSADVENFQTGKVNRLRNTRLAIGGKGINVAIVLRRLQTDVECMGFVGEGDLAFFLQEMEQEDIRFYAMQVAGSVRRNIKISDAQTHVVTEFNEQGPKTDPEALDEMMKTMRRQAKDSSHIALCGSLPPGCAPDTYQTLMRRMPEKRWIVDSSGEALRYAVAEKPFLVKPNQMELSELVGAPLETPEAVKNAAIGLCRSGVGYVAVSLGGEGAILTDGEKTVFAPAVKVEAISTVGAGDSLLAGILYGLTRGETPFESLRYGIAAGAACVQGGGISAFSENDFATLLPKTEIRNM